MKIARNFAQGNLEDSVSTWRLWDLRSGCRIYRLEAEQVRALVSSMTKERRNDWVGWDPVREEWRPLFEFYGHDGEGERRETTQTAVGEPEPEASALSRAGDEELTGERAAVHGGVLPKLASEETNAVQDASERRKYKRIQVTVPAELRSDDHKVLMSTVDLSVGGMRFQERIPRRFDGPFTVRFLIAGACIEVKCEALWTSKGESFRAKVIDKTSSDLMRLLMTEVLQLAGTAAELENY